MKKLMVKQVRLNTSNLTYYAQIESETGHAIWLTITEEEARWMHKVSGCKANGVAGGRGDEHNIYWVF